MFVYILPHRLIRRNDNITMFITESKFFNFLFIRIYLSNDLFLSYFWFRALYSCMLISPIRRACY
jgi:hypothetical protein